jgi:multidrug transporter EmrE-like cation transporter
MTSTWWLVAAVVAEAIGLGALRASRGLRRPLATVSAFVGIEGSVVLVGQAIVAGVSLAVGYAVWTGAGIAFAALGGVLVFGDRLTRRQSLGIGLVLVGVALLNAGGGA